MMKSAKPLALTLLIWLTSLVPAHAWNSDSAHWNEWDIALGLAGNSPRPASVFYNYRTLAVAHPEVYLKADKVFTRILSYLPGSQAAYVHPNPRDVAFFNAVREGQFEGGYFSWSRWSVVADSVYDQAADRELSRILDYRMAPAAVLLLSHSPRLSTFECAVMSYLQRSTMPTKETRKPALFVILAQDGTGYLAVEGEILKAGLTPLTADPKTIAPILIFSEDAVYYPLFGRDDRGADANLTALCERLSAGVIPELSVADQKRAERLRMLTDLSSTDELRGAVLAALHVIDETHPGVTDAWSEYWGGEAKNDLRGLRATAPALTRLADRLSPQTAMLAGSIVDRELRTGLLKLRGAYLEQAGTHPSATEGESLTTDALGVLWSLGLTDETLDDIIRTKAGGSTSHASAMSAILSIAGVAHVGLSTPGGNVMGRDVDWLIAGDGQFEYSLGMWSRYSPSSDREQSRTIVITGAWSADNVSRITSDTIWTTADPFVFAEEMRKLGASLPHAVLVVRHGTSLKPFTQFTADLAGDAVPVVSVPLPNARSEIEKP